MSLFLVQHGVALPKDEDPEQGLSEAGTADVERIAAVAKAYSVQPARIEHSPKKRARDTARILATHLNPAGPAVERTGIKAMDDVLPVAREADSSANVMLVSHLPFLERLTGQLVAGDPDNRVFRFQNGGIVCLDSEDGDWFVKWALMPTVS